MGLSAVTAYMTEPAVLTKLAVPIKLVEFDTNLLLLPGQRRGVAASPYTVPQLLLGAVRATGRGVVQTLTPCAPVFSADCLAGEALGIDTGVDPGP